MRETLYRGKRIDNEKWVEGFYFQRTNTLGDVIGAFVIDDAYPQVANGQFYLRSNIGTENWRIDSETLGQYIGRLDKNQKRIFEGDIVETKYGRACVVKWVSFSGHVGWDLIPVCTIRNLKHDAPDRYDIWYPDNLRVVGNIFDNPELLKEDE